MAKSRRRVAAAARKRARKESWKSMTSEQREEFNRNRYKTAKSGYAKRLRAFGPTLARMAAHVGVFPDRMLA